MKKIVVDLDNTITMHDSSKSYDEQSPNKLMIDTLRDYHRQGIFVTIFTARNMRTFSGDVDKIRKHTLPIIIEWLDKHSVPYDEILIGKPWCGHDGFYVDDRAIRPSEFVSMTEEQIRGLFE